MTSFLMTSFGVIALRSPNPNGRGVHIYLKKDVYKEMKELKRHYACDTWSELFELMIKMVRGDKS